MKRSLYIRLFVFAALLQTVQVWADDDILFRPGDGIQYRIIDETNHYAEAYYCDFDRSEYNVASTVKYNDIDYTVTRIGDGCFNTFNSWDYLSARYQITKIRIPSTVKSIGKWSFRCNYSLNTLIFPEGLETMEEQAIDACTALDSLIIPSTVKSIGDRAISEPCRNFKLYYLPSCTGVTLPSCIIGSYYTPILHVYSGTKGEFTGEPWSDFSEIKDDISNTAPTTLSFDDATLEFPYQMSIDVPSCTTDNTLWVQHYGFELSSSAPTIFSVDNATQKITNLTYGEATITAKVRGTDVTATFNVKCENKKYFVVTSGPAGVSTDYLCHLTDGKYTSDGGTKYCMISYTGPMSIYFMATTKVLANGYTIYTGGDNAEYTGRNPKSWKFYGSRNNKTWTLLHTVTNDTQMQNANWTGYSYSFDNTTEYKYYRLDIEDIQNEENKTLAMGGFVLKYDGNSIEGLNSIDHYYVGDKCAVCGTANDNKIEMTISDSKKALYGMTFYLDPALKTAAIAGTNNNFVHERDLLSFNNTNLAYGGKIYTLGKINSYAFSGYSYKFKKLIIPDNFIIMQDAFNHASIEILELGANISYDWGSFEDVHDLKNAYISDPRSVNIEALLYKIDLGSATLCIPDDTYQSAVTTYPQYQNFAHILSNNTGIPLTPTLTFTDAQPTITPNSVDYRVGDLKYTRSVSGSFGSACFPFDINVSDIECGDIYVPLAQAIRKSDDKLMLFLDKKEDTETITAGTPFLIKYKDGTETFTIANSVRTGITSEITSNPTPTAMATYEQPSNSGLVYRDKTVDLKWCGTYVETAKFDGMKSFNSDGSFGQHTGETLKPYRAYISHNGSTQAAKQLVIVADFGDDAPTEIQQITEDGSNIQIENSRVYNLNGQRFNSPIKGINIINGKKIFVR